MPDMYKTQQNSTIIHGEFLLSNSVVCLILKITLFLCQCSNVC